MQSVMKNHVKTYFVVRVLRPGFSVSERSYILLRPGFYVLNILRPGFYVLRRERRPTESSVSVVSCIYEGTCAM